MILTQAQVAEKFGSASGFVKSLVKRGLLKPVNTLQPGKKRFYAKYESRDVQELLKTGVVAHAGRTSRVRVNDAVVPPNGAAATGALVNAVASIRAAAAAPAMTMGSVVPAMGPGILSRLDNIERKLDALLAIWS